MKRSVMRRDNDGYDVPLQLGRVVPELTPYGQKIEL